MKLHEQDCIIAYKNKKQIHTRQTKKTPSETRPQSRPFPS